MHGKFHYFVIGAAAAYTLGAMLLSLSSSGVFFSPGEATGIQSINPLPYSIGLLVITVLFFVVTLIKKKNGRT